MTCNDCKTRLPLQVLKSHAGYYIGYLCPTCGPYDRLTGYYGSDDTAKGKAQADLAKGTWVPRI